MIPDDLFKRADADVRRLLRFATAPVGGPAPEWDPDFVFGFAWRLRTDPDYKAAAKLASQLFAAGRFLHPDVTADPGDRAPKKSFAAWLAAAEDKARRDLDKKAAEAKKQVADAARPEPTPYPGATVSTEPGGSSGVTDRKPYAFDVYSEFKFWIDVEPTAAATGGPVTVPSSAIGYRTSVPEAALYWTKQGADNAGNYLNVNCPGRWFHDARMWWQEGNCYVELPQSVQVGPANLLLWAGDRFVRGVGTDPDQPGRVWVRFPGVAPTRRQGLFLLEEVDPAFGRLLRSGRGEEAAAVAHLIAASKLSTDFAQELAWCANNHPDELARHAARVALGGS